MGKFILVSIKEKYVVEILRGNKTIELRKSIPNCKAGDVIIIYTTKPVMAITAMANIGKIILCSPAEMWEKYSVRLGISKEDFFDYYRTSNKAVGIELLNATKLNDQILLSVIKGILPNFSPPQTFKYLNNLDAEKLKFHPASI